MLRCERRGASLPGAAEPQHRGRGRLSGLGEGCCGCGGGRDRPPAAGTGRGSRGAAAAWRYPGGPSGRGGRGGGSGGGSSSGSGGGSPTPRGTCALPSAASVAVSREPSGMRGLSPPELRLAEAAPPAPSVRAHRLPAARDPACYGALERPFVAVGRRPAARRHAPSTYCSTMVQHCEALGRAVQVVNLDPAAEQFSYPVMADIRELIEVDDVMEDESLRFGPNGGLVFCMEYFANNFNWLEESLGHVEDDYILFDCPGQIELYTHLPVMKQLVEQLQQWEFRVCGVFLVDSQFMVESFKFISGILAALSAMISLEIPQINIMTKMDLLSKKAKKEIEKYLDPDMYSMIEDSTNILKSKMFKKLTKSICGLIDDYGMVRFLPFDRSDEESINIVLQHIDFTIQYGEDLEFKEPKECEEDKSALVDEYFQDHVDE
ncbi:GPN-loop GTPase 3 isoform X1 [Phalacrocorax carbo]|uniref:GPN-loop GTPase 3 isoform X1 n=1 Tax=Phalacrocorax carbo TaxID=9209 RepID=UPI003119CA03